MPNADTIASLRRRLEEAEATIRGIESGEIDAIIVQRSGAPQIYTLENADRPYRIFLEQMGKGALTLDSTGLILYSNPHFASLLGLPVDSVMGTDIFRFLSPPDALAMRALIEAAAARGRSSGEISVQCENGESIPVRLALTELDLGDLKPVCVVLSDLREQRRNEALLKEGQLSRLMLEQAGEAIVVIDSEGTVIRASESAAELAGATVLYKPFDAVLPLSCSSVPLDAAGILAAMRSGLVIRSLEAVLQLANGDSCTVILSASPLVRPPNELLGCVVTLTDITDRKRSEQALAAQTEELTRANNDLRQFAYSASHDLREPLRQVAVFSELLQRKYDGRLDEEAQQLIRYTVDGAHRMEELLRGLLEYSQAASRDRPAALADTNMVLRRTLESFQPQLAEIGGVIDVDSLPRLRVNEVHLTQLFQNLIGNALKYRADAPPRIFIRAEGGDGMRRIAVSDNGIGIPANYREQIFILFKRLHGGAKYAGSGIGLAICQKIVQSYGGRIWVEPAGEQGSKFIFTLPGEDNGAS